MDLPAIEIASGESVLEAAGRLEEICRTRGIRLSGFDTLNTSLSISRFANFFQAWVDGSETIIVILTEELTPASLVKVLDILLEIRADPDPPGVKLRFRFFSAHPIPPLLDTLFGDHRISPLECRAAMAASFGIDMRADACPRLAAVGVQILASLGVMTDFKDPNGVTALRDFVLREIHGPRFPPDGEPLNTLICVGCLYGEMLRSRLPFKTEWALVKEYQTWPLLVIRLRPEPSQPPARAGAVSPTLGFNPIASVIRLSQEGKPDILEKAEENLLDRCRKELGPGTA
jgi:hypothetical protein